MADPIDPRDDTRTTCEVLVLYLRGHVEAEPNGGSDAPR